MYFVISAPIRIDGIEGIAVLFGIDRIAGNRVLLPIFARLSVGNSVPRIPRSHRLNFCHVSYSGFTDQYHEHNQWGVCR